MNKNKLNSLAFELNHELSKLSGNELDGFIASNSVIIKSLIKKIAHDDCELSELNQNDVIFNGEYKG